MTGPGTLDLRADLEPDLLGMFADYGQDLGIVIDTGTLVWGTPGSARDVTFTVRGLLMPADLRRQQAAAGAGLPVPQFEAYLPMVATQGGVSAPLDLGTPGWFLLHGGQRFTPTADARDEGGQGIVWIVPLSAPGEVTRGDPEPDWTLPPAP